MQLLKASGQLTSEQEEAVDAIRYDLRSAFRFPQFWDGDDGGDDGGDGDDGDDTGGDGTGGDGGDSGDIKDPDKKRLSDEAAQHRNRAKAAEKERDEALAKVREYEDKDKSDLQKAERDRDEAKSKVETLQTENLGLKAEVATLRAASKFRFKDADDAMDLAIRRAGIKGDEDDLEDLITEALEKLSKDKPYLLEDASDGDDGDDGDGEEQPPSGRSTNGKKGSKTKLTDEKLFAKFPALAGR